MVSTVYPVELRDLLGSLTSLFQNKVSNQEIAVTVCIRLEYLR